MTIEFKSLRVSDVKELAMPSKCLSIHRVEIFVADWKIAMNNFTNNTSEGQPGESEQDKSNFRFIQQ